MISVCKSAVRMAALEKGTLNLDKCINEESKPPKTPNCFTTSSSLPSQSSSKGSSSVLPSPLSYVFQYITLRPGSPKNLLMPRTAVGLACSGASSTGDCLSNQLLKPPIRNGTSTAEFAGGEGREEDKTESTETFFSQIFEKLLRSCTEFQRKVMPK